MNQLLVSSAIAAINPRNLINVSDSISSINGEIREKDYEFTRRNTDLR